MSDKKEIVNRVQASGLISLDLEQFYRGGKRVQVDLADFLHEGLILKEKEFREKVKDTNWEFCRDCHVAVYCSTDAIVPTWAFMVLATKLAPVAQTVVFGSLPELENTLFKDALEKIDIEEFRDAKVVVKGCGKIPVPPAAYLEITRLLQPVVQSIMYGEPCSTVPVFKKSK